MRTEGCQGSACRVYAPRQTELHHRGQAERITVSMDDFLSVERFVPPADAIQSAGALQIRAIKVGTLQIHASKIGTGKNCARKIGTLQIGISKIGARQISERQVHAGHVCPPQIRADQYGP